MRVLAAPTPGREMWGSGQNHRGDLSDTAPEMPQRLSLSGSPELFHAAFDACADLIYILDPASGRFLEVNETTCEVLGYSRDELLSRGVHEIQPGVTQTDVRRRLAQIVAMRPKPSVCDAVFRRKDGTEFPVEINRRAIVIGSFTVVIATARDVSERRRMEQDLGNREALLRVTFDAAPVGINMVGLDGRFLRANTAYQRLVGYTEEELRQLDPLSLTYHDDRSRNSILRSELLSGKRRSFEIEKRYQTKSGKLIWVRNTVSLVNDPSGNSLFTVGVAQDISERKRAERALEESREYYRQMFVSNPMPMWVLEFETFRFLEVNQAAISAYGYTCDEFERMTSFDLRPPEDVPAYRAFTQQLDWTNEVSRRRTRHRKKDGSIIHVETTSYPYRFNGKAARLVLAADVTDRLAAERALKESEERFRAAFEQAAVGMALRDIEPRRPRWLRVNQKLCEIFGYTSEEMLQLTSLDLTAPEDRDTGIGYNERVARGELSSYTREKRYVRKNGEVFWASLSLSAVRGADGRPTHVISAIQDITERKRADAAIREYNRRLKALSGRLVSLQETERQQLSRELHDRIGQNLTALGINVDIIRRQLGSNAAPQLIKRVADSLTLIDATTDCVENVMTELRPPLLDDQGLMPALRCYCEEFQERTGILTIVSGPCDGSRLESEIETSIYRIAQEALTNVAKHAKATHATVDLTLHDNVAALAICDDGVGFDAASVLEADTRKGCWGMMSMRERAEAVSGFLEVESTPGSGTRITARIVLYP